MIYYSVSCNASEVLTEVALDLDKVVSFFFDMGIGMTIPLVLRSRGETHVFPSFRLG